MSVEWRDLQRRYRYSVVQITCTRGSYDLSAPFNTPSTQEAKGSGFLITPEGHVLTNAHVVEGAIAITFRAERSGNKDLRAELIATCPAKDVALLKISTEALEELGEFDPFEFGDDQGLEQTQPVMTISFPLGSDRIKFTSGVTSGYEAPNAEGAGSQSYIQIDAPVSPGSSGSPLLTEGGYVVGIISAGIAGGNAQNTNFAIPARVVLSVMRALFGRSVTPGARTERGSSESESSCNSKSQPKITLRCQPDHRTKIVSPPSLGLALQRITSHHFRMAGVESLEDQKGLRVKEIIPGCPFPEVLVDDIIQLIRYADPYNSPSAFSVETYRSEACTRCASEPDHVIEISATGSIKVYDTSGPDPTEVQFTRDRKVSLQEVIDTIPIDTVLTLEVLRPSIRKVGSTSGPFRNRDGMAIRKLYPPFDELEYLIFGGAVFIPLSANVLDALGGTKYLCEFNPYRARYKNRVIITKIFPLTDIKDIDSINATEVVKRVNSTKIATIADMESAIVNAIEHGEYITITFRSGKVVVLDPDVAIQQDKSTHEKFQIKPNNFSLRLWDGLL